MVQQPIMSMPVEAHNPAISAVYNDGLGFRQALRPLPVSPVRRVALFAESFPPKVDGVAKSAYLTVRYLQQTGREVLVFAPDNAPAYVGPSRVISLRSLGVRFAPETRVALPNPRVERALNAFEPDLIHMFSPALMSVMGVWSGRRRNIAVVANYQTDLPGYARRSYYPGLRLVGPLLVGPLVEHWLRFLHNNCHLTLVGSRHTLRALQDSGFHRLRLWQRGVDVDHFNPAHRSPEWRARLLNGRGAESLICLYVGRLAPEKRIDLLLDVAKLPGVALTVIGDGPLRPELEKLFAGTDTHFTGYLVGDDLARALASGDVFAFPGPNETFGQVVQEAMAAGLPSVIINQGGIVDLITEGLNGFVCPDDPQAFADAVRLLRDDPELRQRLARTARHMAEQRPWETIMQQLEDYYAEATALNARRNRV